MNVIEGTESDAHSMSYSQKVFLVHHLFKEDFPELPWEVKKSKKKAGAMSVDVRQEDDPASLPPAQNFVNGLLGEGGG